MLLGENAKNMYISAEDNKEGTKQMIVIKSNFVT